jgi:hypothetical protein
VFDHACADLDQAVKEVLMSRVFITGASTGLGLMAGQLLIEQGHQVVLHGRNETRADEAMASAPGAEAAVVGDLSVISEVRAVADQVNRLGRFDAVIHNAGVGYREPRRIITEDGLPHIFAINVLAPYILTALIERPDRLVYLSSGMHRGAEANLGDMLWSRRRGQGAQAWIVLEHFRSGFDTSVQRWRIRHGLLRRNRGGAERQHAERRADDLPSVRRGVAGRVRCRAWFLEH